MADLSYLFKRNGDFHTVFALSKTNNELSSSGTNLYFKFCG